MRIVCRIDCAGLCGLKGLDICRRRAAILHVALVCVEATYYDRYLDGKTENGLILHSHIWTWLFSKWIEKLEWMKKKKMKMKEWIKQHKAYNLHVTFYVMYQFSNATSKEKYARRRKTETFSFFLAMQIHSAVSFFLVSIIILTEVSHLRSFSFKFKIVAEYIYVRSSLQSSICSL